MKLPPLEPVNEIPLHPRPGVDGSISRYGHFDPARREYVITRPDTPQAWYNYITNGSFTGFVSQTGGGTCFAGDPLERRLLRTHLHGRPADQPGRWVYVRDRDSGRFHSATWAPVYTPLRRFKYECRVGTGYTTIEAECDKIRTSITYFVGPDAAAEIWRLTVTNADRRRRKLDIFPYAEIFFWSLERDNNLDSAAKCTDVLVAERAIVHRSYYDWGERRGGWKRQFGWFAAGEAPASMDTNIEAFVGVHRGYDAPLAVEAGQCSNFFNRGGEPVAAMQIPLTLRPGESREMVFAVGYSDSEAQAKRDARRVATVSFADRQLAKVRKGWQRYLAHFQAETGEPTFDVPFNTFSPYQSGVTFICSRSLAPYLITGARGIGFRDSTQDTLGAMPYEPHAASKRLLSMLLSAQQPSGEACHTFYPASGVGSGGGCWDDHLWPCLAVEWYVKESGDLGFLDERLGYHGSDQTSSVMEHLLRSLEFTASHVGANGLPLLGKADWNDCLNAYPGAESLFTAGLYCAALKSVEALHRARGEDAQARACAATHADQARRINDVGWDGKWYRRLITADGAMVGSKTNKRGKIWIESNVWAVIGQAAPPDRARTALDSVRKHLCTPYGHRICYPAYDQGYDPTVGTVTIFAPGYKENGAIFCHTNPWLVVAEAMLGRGERAFDAFRRVSPYTKDRIQPIHCAEPYSVNSMIVMPPNLEAGRARNPWLTGTAAWMTACMCRAILGVRPDFNALVIDPCVPRWERFAMKRIFRGVTYDIRVSNPDRVERGVREMKVAGRLVAGNAAPVVEGKRKVRVDVLMGS